MSTRRFITCLENNYKYEFSDNSRVITREPSLVDSFYSEEGICPDDGEKTICYTDPLIMLFNQERLSKMGDVAIKMWLDSLSKNSSSGVNVLKESLSDDELLQLVKSRHIQNPSELKAYLDWCNENVDAFTKEVQALQAQQQSEQTVETETKSE